MGMKVKLATDGNPTCPWHGEMEYVGLYGPYSHLKFVCPDPQCSMIGFRKQSIFFANLRHPQTLICNKHGVDVKNNKDDKGCFCPMCQQEFWKAWKVFEND